MTLDKKSRYMIIIQIKKDKYTDSRQKIALDKYNDSRQNALNDNNQIENKIKMHNKIIINKKI